MTREKPLYPWGQPISSWEEVRAEIEGNARSKRTREGDKGKLPDPDQDGPACEEEEPEQFAEVAGELPPLAPEGPRVMVCVGHKVLPTRFGPKEYLYWRDEETGLVLPQYFRQYAKYPVGSKAVRTFIAALGARPKRIDRMSLRKLVGLRAMVFVETVHPAYNSGALKGQPMPESLSYSKVAEILEPLGRVDLTTLN